ncbi:MAG TPA: serine/threonine-protein kinase [Labilithrix sp.]|nr:serine/threonine-protein kinase [Labilithrix sp.]
MTFPEAEVPPSAGLVGGKYQLVKLIGRGGMGSVWEARHCNLGTPVAIKFIEAEYANSAEARSRFDKEAKAAATIQSKHAIQIFDNGVTEEGKPYIVMELLQGEPLDKRIDRLGQLTLQDTARILQQVSRGLSKAHERGIIHRDLKPENVFIVHNNDDDDEVAKVLDFGIAKIQNSPHSPGITSSTKTGAVLGTPFYMSPEQARGLRNVDHRTDVWSLGVIAFKCVTGKLPFDGESVGDLLVKICTAPIPLPSHFVPGLPQAFDSWFLRALEREPDRRFSNVTELAEHLAFAAGIGTRGPTSSQAYSGPHGNPHPVSATIAASSHTTPSPAQRASMAAGPNASYGSRTPNPAGMTAAPFTSSQPVPGVSGGRGKWLVGAALTGLLLAGGATAAAVKIRNKNAANTVVGVTQLPPPAEKSAPPPPVPVPVATETAAAIAPLASDPAATTAEPKATLAAGGKPAAGIKAGKTGAGKPPAAGAGALAAAAAPPLPPPGGGPAAQPPVTAAPATTPAGAAAKKPNKNDPGY